MSSLSTEPSAKQGGDHLVLYDGVCGLCNRLIQFLLAHDRHGVLAFAPLQSATGRDTVARFGGNPHELTTFYLVTNYRTDAARMISRSRAVLFLAWALGWPWRVATVARALPWPLLDRFYDVIARHRYRVFGRLDGCPMPRQELRSRFIDI